MSAPSHPLSPFFSQDNADIEEIVASIDPGLGYLQDLNPSASTCRTLLVQDDADRRILKVRQQSSNLWDDTYFNLEVLALKRAGERNLTGVTHMMRHYRNDQYEAVLKTFVPGTPGNHLDADALLSDVEFVRKLDSLYMDLHLAGIAKVNFVPRKVVIGDAGKVTLVDLSSCVVNTEHGIGRFVQEMREDSRFISRLERLATSL